MDALQDAYLQMASGGLKRISMISLSEVFLKEYNRLRLQHFNECFTTSHPDEVFFELLAGDLEDPMTTNHEKEAERDKLAIAVARFIGAAFSTQENSIWSMRIKGFSIRDIADAHGIPERRVKEVTLNITKRTQRQFANAI